jgi:hypothetical protein
VIALSTGPLDARMAKTPLTVGDPLVVELRGILPRGARLVDAVPRVRDTLPDGLRVLSADSLRVRDGVVTGQLHLAFFRPDSQVVPSFAIAYHSASGTDTLVSSALPVLVHPVLPTGNATLRDVRDVDAPWPLAPVGVVLGLVLVTWLVLRRLRPRRHVAPQAHVPRAQSPSAYDDALAQLREIDRAELPVEQRYARAADVVRGYIAATRGVPALERTTPEILTALGTNGALESFLREADLVKFAGVRPEAYRARAREVIDALR